MSKTIEQELMAATKVKKSKDRQKFLTAVVEATNNLSDDAWGDLSPEAQKWFNAAVKSHKAEKDIPEFPDLAAEESATGEEVDAAAKSDEDEDEEEAADDKKERTVKAKKTKAAANGTAKTKETAPAKKKVKTSAGPGAPTIIKLMMLKKPDISKDELIEKLQAKGLKLSPLTVSTQRADFRHSLKVLQEAGMLKKNLSL